jgi:NitT/TauT family transport system substrate-binding protein
VLQGADDLRAVTSPNKSLPFLIAAQGRDRRTGRPAGRSFGVGRVGSLDHSLSMKVLESEGVDTDALEIVTLGQPAVRAQALAAGQIDATTMSIGVWMSMPSTEGSRCSSTRTPITRPRPW